MHRIIETEQPSVALVVATFAAVPFVHLTLESRRRNYPDLPLLVHDDGSPQAGELEALCNHYCVDFFNNPRRMRPTVGDLSSYLHGLDWAADRGADLLVKMSRRFVPIMNWVPDLQRVAWETQYATYSQVCLHHNYGFRTECLAFHVPSWRKSQVYDDLAERVARNEPVFVEGYIHNLARQVQMSACEANRQYELTNPRLPESNAFGVWGLMPDRRVTRTPNLVWHDSDAPVDYARVALLYGLPYGTEDFEDPNQGFGNGGP